MRIAKAEDTLPIANMLKRMAIEILPEYASDDDDVYWNEVFKYMRDPEYYVYVDHKYRGFFMVKDDIDPIYEDYHRYIFTKIYIYPEYRGGRVYKNMTEKVIEDFKDGDVIGVTEINSPHIHTLEKRHERIANVYKLNKELRWE